jgi:hypothetical protein
MRVKAAPLKASFMLTAMLGFLISVVYVRKIDLSWAVAFAVVFFVMIIAALIAMVQAPERGQLVPNLEREFAEKKAPRKKAKKSRKKK